MTTEWIAQYALTPKNQYGQPMQPVTLAEIIRADSIVPAIKAAKEKADQIGKALTESVSLVAVQEYRERR